MTKKGGGQQRPKEEIEGIELLDPLSLPAEFRRFRNDDLYFIHTVQYFPRDAKPQSRCVALTPVAFFVTDVNGNMDRATRCEMLSESYYQIQQVKKLFGPDEQVHFIIKIPKEYDVHFAFEKEKENKSAMKFLDVLRKLCSYRQKREFKVNEIPADANFNDYYNAEAPKGFMSPQEIIRANNERRQQQEQVEKTMNEILKLEGHLESLKKNTAEKQQTLSRLEAAIGVDHSALREEKQKLADEHVTVHKQHTMLEIDLVKLNADIARAREQLNEQRNNRDKIMEEKLQDADNSIVNQQNEMMLLRQKAQKREVDKAQMKLDNLRVKLSTPNEYSGPENLVARVKELEGKVDQVAQRWEREMESAGKVEKFLDTINVEIEKIGRQVSELHEQKARLLQERDAALRAQQAPPPLTPTAEPPAAAAAALVGDDDDLLGGGAAPAPAKAILDDDDDLLGSGGIAPSAAAAAPAAANDDDDLLGGGGGGGAPPAAAEDVGDLL